MSNEALTAALEPADETAMTTQEIMAYLGDAERDRFVLLQETFESAGWRLVVDHAVAMSNFEAINGANAKTWEDCVGARGRREAWVTIARLADQFMSAFEHAAASAKSEAETASTEDFS